MFISCKKEWAGVQKRSDDFYIRGICDNSGRSTNWLCNAWLRAILWRSWWTAPRPISARRTWHAVRSFSSVELWCRVVRFCLAERRPGVQTPGHLIRFSSPFLKRLLFSWTFRLLENLRRKVPEGVVQLKRWSRCFWLPTNLRRTGLSWYRWRLRVCYRPGRVRWLSVIVSVESTSEVGGFVDMKK